MPPLGAGGAPAQRVPPFHPLHSQDPSEFIGMPQDTLQFGLLFAGWVVSFLLGKELHVGYKQWRMRAAESPIRRPRD